MKRLISIFLALIMLAISANVGVAYHYCSGSLALYKIVIGYGEAYCGMEQMEKDQGNYASTLSPVNCCDDHFQQIITDDFQSSGKLMLSPADFTASVPLAKPLFKIEFKGVKPSEYRPPPVITAVYLPLLQAFLI